MKQKIDEKWLRQVPFSTEKQQLYFDTITPGFGVCIGKTKKTFFVQKTKNYQTSRVTLGTYPLIKCMEAKELALKITSEIVSNDDFKTNRKSKRVLNQVTLQHLYDQYKPKLKAKGKTSSLDEYPKILQKHFFDWLDKPITNIDRNSVVKRHQEITQKCGPAISNKSFRVLRALFNYARIDNDNITNPVLVLSEKQLWNKELPKKSKLNNGDFEEWMRKLLTLLNPTMKYYLIFILLHGLRRSEASNLRWADVDLKNNCFTVRNTKNKKDLTLPITSYSKVLFEQLRVLQVNDYVFPSTSINSDRIKSARKSLGKLNRLTGTNITTHDLRRSFVSVGHSFISPYHLKSIINHSTANDVTSIYVSQSCEDLLEPLQTVQTKIFELSKVDLNDLR